MDPRLLLLLTILFLAAGIAAAGEYLGRYSSNPYSRDATANPYSQAGSPYSSKSINNLIRPGQPVPQR